MIEHFDHYWQEFAGWGVGAGHTKHDGKGDEPNNKATKFDTMRDGEPLIKACLNCSQDGITSIPTHGCARPSRADDQV